VLRLRKEIVHPRDRPQGRAAFVGLEHIESGTGKRTGALELDMARLTGRKPRFYAGDIVYGYLRPYLNKVWIAEFDGLCSVDQYVYEVRPDVADTDYIAWFMRSPLYLSRAPIQTTPGQLPRIRTEEVASVHIDLPPLAEQRRIAAILAEQMAAVERARAAAEAQVEAAEALSIAHLREAFGSEEAQTWPRRRIAEIASVNGGIQKSPDRAPKSFHRPYLTVRNV
jgi:type I restriction enzyme S subunit